MRDGLLASRQNGRRQSRMAGDGRITEDAAGADAGLGHLLKLPVLTC